MGLVYPSKSPFSLPPCTFWVQYPKSLSEEKKTHRTARRRSWQLWGPRRLDKDAAQAQPPRSWQSSAHSAHARHRPRHGDGPAAAFRLVSFRLHNQAPEPDWGRFYARFGPHIVHTPHVPHVLTADDLFKTQSVRTACRMDPPCRNGRHELRRDAAAQPSAIWLRSYHLDRQIMSARSPNFKPLPSKPFGVLSATTAAARSSSPSSWPLDRMAHCCKSARHGVTSVC